MNLINIAAIALTTVSASGFYEDYSAGFALLHGAEPSIELKQAAFNFAQSYCDLKQQDPQLADDTIASYLLKSDPSMGEEYEFLVDLIVPAVVSADLNLCP